MCVLGVNIDCFLNFLINRHPSSESSGVAPVTSDVIKKLKKIRFSVGFKCNFHNGIGSCVQFTTFLSVFLQHYPFRENQSKSGQYGCAVLLINRMLHDLKNFVFEIRTFQGLKECIVNWSETNNLYIIWGAKRWL